MVSIPRCVRKSIPVVVYRLYLHNTILLSAGEPTPLILILSYRSLSVRWPCLWLFVWQRFFDALAVAKGPSLGTNFTLACPYTLLAHYLETEWAETFGVEKELVRVSVGLENIEVYILYIIRFIDRCTNMQTLQDVELISSLLRAV